ncbi:MAG: HAMP domain-containing histidine kinase [Lachnospiraceae bacterium]|nr:HAMP domain-containing histidine kinase [Lachnospiraceae bacterium]
MNKLKKSGLAKFIACLILSVALVCAVVCTLVQIYMYNYHLRGDASENLKEDMIENIADEYMNEIVWNYYYAVIHERAQEIAYYENKFSEENSNLAFSIVPASPNKHKLPSLSNFSCSDYQYSKYDRVSVPTKSVERSFVYYLGRTEIDELLRGKMDYASFSVIVDSDGEEHYFVELNDTGVTTTEAATTEGRLDVTEVEVPNTDITETNPYLTTAENFYEYDNAEDIDYGSSRDLDESLYTDVYTYYKYYHGYDVTGDHNYQIMGDGTINGSNPHIEDRNYVANNGIHAFSRDDGKWCYLDMSSDFCERYNNFFLTIDSKYEDWSYTEYFEPDTMSYHVDVVGLNYAEVDVNYYVKSNITATDLFYYSPVIRYIDIIVDYSVGMLIASILLILVMGGYLVSAAGHGNASDELYLSFIDKIPYDLMLAISCFLVVLAGVVPGYHDFISVVAVSVLTAFIVPILLYTTSARIKVGGLFKNTICYRLLKLLYMGCKKLGKTSGKCIRVLWNKLNVYGKYFGVFILVAALEAFSLMAGAIGPFVMFWIFEKVAFGVILIVICINMSKLKDAGNQIANGAVDYEVDTEGMLGEFKRHGENLNSIQSGISNAVAESLKSEHMKTELITNVSHDLKTPLTSIINYVDLLKKEELNNETATEYIEVLDRQSARLKKLIQDLIDASKASTGNLDVTLEKMGIQVILNQVLGEFEDKLEKRGIKTIVKCEDEYYVMADGRLLWRVMENLINNVAKYALDNSRVYVDVENCRNGYISVTFKNISKDELNISGDELMERFVRGDRSRNTEGSGLGLSIARSLMELQKGQIEIIVDGDLFKVVLLLIVG